MRIKGNKRRSSVTMAYSEMARVAALLLQLPGALRGLQEESACAWLDANPDRRRFFSYVFLRTHDFSLG